MKTYILSQFLGRPWRSIAVIAGVALGAALFVTLSALGNGFREAARAPMSGVAADMVVTRPTGAGGTPAQTQRLRGTRLPSSLAPISSNEAQVVESTEGVSAISTALQVWDFGPTSYQTILGINPAQSEVGPGRSLETSLVKGRTFGPEERGVAVADLHYAAFYKLEPGASATVDGRQFQVVGIVELKDGSQAAAANLYLPLADVQTLAGLGQDQLNQVYAKVAQAGQVDQVVGRLTNRLGNVSVITEDSMLQVMGGIGQVSARFTLVAALVGLLGGLVLASLALSGLIAERRREIGILKAVGWRTRDVEKSFLLEALFLSVAGGLAGMALGGIGAWLLGQIPMSDVVTPLNEGMVNLQAVRVETTAVVLPAHADLVTLLLAFTAAVGGGTLAGWSGARRAAALKPARVLRGK